MPTSAPHRGYRIKSGKTMGAVRRIGGGPGCFFPISEEMSIQKVEGYGPKWVSNKSPEFVRGELAEP